MPKYDCIKGLYVTGTTMSTGHKLFEGTVDRIERYPHGSTPNLYKIDLNGRERLIPLDRVDVRRLEALKSGRSIEIFARTEMYIMTFKKGE